jgi:hypothetical protein
MSNAKKFYIGLFIILTMGIVTRLSKQSMTLLYFDGAVNENFLNVYGFVDLLFGVITPFILYTFLCISSFLMANIVGENITLKVLYAHLGIGFLPLLLISIITSFFPGTLDHHDLKHIVDSNASGREFYAGISLKQLKVLTWIGYLSLYVYIFLFLKRYMGFEIINALLVTGLPTLIVAAIYLFA